MTAWVRLGLVQTLVIGLVVLFVEPWIGAVIIAVALLGWLWWEDRHRR